MKLTFGNRFSVTLWAEEVEDVQISESSIIYKTPQGKQITIRIPASWTQPNKDETQDDNKNTGGGQEDRRSNLRQSTKHDKKDVVNFSCLQPPQEFEALESEIENFKLKPLKNPEHEKEIIRLFERQAQHGGEIEMLQMALKETNSSIEQIWTTIEEDNQWKTSMEFDKNKAGRQNYNQKQNKRNG